MARPTLESRSKLFQDRHNVDDNIEEPMMPLTQAEIDAFRDFAMRKITNGGAESLQHCLQMWEEERESAESVAMIRDSLEDSAAGRTRPLDQAFADICRQLGIPEHSSAS